MLWFDATMGLKKGDWDVKWSKEQFETLFRQMDASSTNRNYMVVVNMWPADNHILVGALRECGFRHEKCITWYKINQNREGTKEVICATEFYWFAFRSTQRGTPFFMPANPMQRHNILVGPTNSTYHKNKAGGKINQTQKPPYVSREIAKAFLEPGSTVIVVGIGAGGDVEGLVSAGMNVIGFEMDAEQFQDVQPIWKKYEEQYLEDSNLFKRMGDSGTFGCIPSVYSLKELMQLQNAKAQDLPVVSVAQLEHEAETQVPSSQVDQEARCVGCSKENDLVECHVDACLRSACADCLVFEQVVADGPKLNFCSAQCVEAAKDALAKNVQTPSSISSSSADHV